MSKPVGGRGKKAPYETITIRIPEPIRAEVERLSEDFRGLVERKLADGYSDYVLEDSVHYEKALEEAKKILIQKKSARESLRKLLQVIYGGEVSKEEL
jgi:hypothetical protein